jgi:hypothetical protein
VLVVKVYVAMEAELPSFLTSILDASGQIHVPDFLSEETVFL